MRNLKVDIAKAFGIMLVVFCHANIAPFAPGRYFHMALFFFLTGYLSYNSYNRNWKDFVLSKIRSLYIPFVIVEILFLAMHQVFVVAGMESAGYQIADYPRLMAHIVCFDNVDMMLSPLWFLTALFFANMLSYGFHKLGSVKWFTLSSCLACIGVAGVFPNPLSINFTEGVNVVLVAQWFCCVGYQIRNVDLHFLFTGKIQLILTLISASFLLLVRWLGLLSVDMRMNRYEPVSLWLLAVACGVYLVFSLSDIVMRWRILSSVMGYIGRNSMPIFVLHIFCFKLVGLMQVRLLGFDASLLPRWENVSELWYWQVTYAAVGMLIPLVLKSLYTYLTGVCRTSS